MKRIILIILVLTSLQGFAQTGFQGYLTNNSYRGINASQKAGLPADTFNVTGTLKNYKWVAVKNNTLWLWTQSLNRWVIITGGGGTTYTFSLPLLNNSNVISIKGLNTVGANGQSIISNGTQWSYNYPFNHDSAMMYSFETKGRLGVRDGGLNLDTLYVDSTVITGYAAKTSAYTITVDDHTINCTSGTFTVTLPTAVGITGQIFIIKNSGAGVITVDGFSSETIDGSPNFMLSTQYKYVAVQAAGGNWITIGNNIP